MESEFAKFQGFPKISRLSRDMVITEKIDGTNAAINITEDGQVLAQKRTSIITPESDNYGFAKWVADNAEMLKRLGPGRHFGEWWGAGIQRRYGLSEKRFSLFDVHRWRGEGLPEGLPTNVGLVPIIYIGPFEQAAWESALANLQADGSFAAPGFKPAEGIIIYHTASGVIFKKTLEKDEKPKGSQESA